MENIIYCEIIKDLPLILIAGAALETRSMFLSMEVGDRRRKTREREREKRHHYNITYRERSHRRKKRERAMRRRASLKGGRMRKRWTTSGMKHLYDFSRGCCCYG